MRESNLSFRKGLNSAIHREEKKKLWLKLITKARYLCTYILYMYEPLPCSIKKGLSPTVMHYTQQVINNMFLQPISPKN